MHRRFGHLGVKNLRKLAKDHMDEWFNYNASEEPEVCVSCAEGNHHRSKFSKDGDRRSDEILCLVHGDVCNKMGTKSLSGGENR